MSFGVSPVNYSDSDSDPNSPEKDKEWRISLSLQERMLVTLFNSSQLKCFVVLKVLKNEVINQKLQGKILTSYHCKTCMLYMVETTPNDLWVPDNLLKCITACLKKLREWANDKYCPNYFIPEENMFDKLESNDLEGLSNSLKTLVTGNICSVLFGLKTDGIGENLRFLAQKCMFLAQGDSQLFKDVSIQLRTGNTVHMLKLREAKLFRIFKCRFEKTIYLLKLRAQVLKNTFSWDLENVVENLRSFINKFECGPIVSEHSAEEKRNVVELLPIIIPTLLSAELALQKRSGTSNKEIRHILTGQKWKASHLPIDSSQLKKSCILYSIGYHHDSLNALKTIPQAFRISSCICVRGANTSI